MNYSKNYELNIYFAVEVCDVLFIKDINLDSILQLAYFLFRLDFYFGTIFQIASFFNMLD